MGGGQEYHELIRYAYVAHVIWVVDRSTMNNQVCICGACDMGGGQEYHELIRYAYVAHVIWVVDRSTMN